MVFKEWAFSPLLSLVFHLKMYRKPRPLVAFWAPCKMYKFPLHLLGSPSDSYWSTCPVSQPGSSAYAHLYNTVRWRQRGHISVPRVVYEPATFLFEWSKTIGSCCNQLYDTATWGLDVYVASIFSHRWRFYEGPVRLPRGSYQMSTTTIQKPETPGSCGPHDGVR